VTFSIIILSILILTTLLLVNPIQLLIDSKHHVYKLEWKRLLKVNLVFQNEQPIIILRILLWQKEYKLLEMCNGTKKDGIKKKGETKKKKTKSKFNFQKKYQKIIRAIQVKQFYLNIDTDNYIWNAYLYPIFHLLKNKKRQLHINYQGDIELVLKIQSRPIKILYALFI